MFTQNGGVNSAVPEPSAYYYSEVQLGPSKGGYGEYDLNAGLLTRAPFTSPPAIIITKIMPARACSTKTADPSAQLVPAGSAVGTIRRLELTVGGVWNMVNNLTNGGGGFYTAASGSYNLGPTNSSNATATPLLVGAVEVIGANGTGTFTQTCGTNAFIGGGGVQGNAPNSTPDAFDNQDAPLVLGFFGGLASQGTTVGKHFGNGVGTYNLNGGLLTGGPASSQVPCGEENTSASPARPFSTKAAEPIAVPAIFTSAEFSQAIGPGPVT